MYLQDFGTTFDIRTVYYNLAVKTAGTQQCRVQNVRTVGCSNHNDAFVSAETVHLNQQLVQSLLALVMATAKTCAALTAYSINFIDKHDARCTFLCLVEQIAYTRCADTDKHFYEVRTGNTEERNSRFTGNCLRQQGFACTRRAIEQNTFRNLSSQVIILLRMLQEFNNLFQLLLGFFSTGNILKGYLQFFLIVATRTALAKVHHLAATGTALIHQHEPQAYDNQHRQNRAENAHPPRWLRRQLCLNVYFLCFQLFYQLAVIRRNGRKFLAIL